MGAGNGRAIFAVVLLVISGSPALLAQRHGEAGLFADYLHLGTVTPAINFAGVGGRAAKRVNRNVQFEAELAYDFQKAFATPLSNGVATALVPSRMSLLNALFGPKFHSNGSHLRGFVTLKVGLLDFMVSRAAIPAGFSAAVNRATNGGTAGAFYPAAGLELFRGALGMRAEVGDEIYFDNGGNSNLRVTVGPQFRF